MVHQVGIFLPMKEHKACTTQQQNLYENCLNENCLTSAVQYTYKTTYVRLDMIYSHRQSSMPVMNPPPYQTIPTKLYQAIQYLQLSITAISIHNATLLSCHFRKIATVSHFRLVFLKASLIHIYENKDIDNPLSVKYFLLQVRLIRQGKGNSGDQILNIFYECELT